MIHLFNRKELLLTSSMERQARVRDVLAANALRAAPVKRHPLGPSTGR